MGQTSPKTKACIPDGTVDFADLIASIGGVVHPAPWESLDELF
jgi:hypothetical protein